MTAGAEYQRALMELPPTVGTWSITAAVAGSRPPINNRAVRYTPKINCPTIPAVPKTVSNTPGVYGHNGQNGHGD
jgi:hypothetical protein